jgi:hypothetical protein
LRDHPAQIIDFHRKTRSSILPTKNNWAIFRLIINELGVFTEKTFRPALHSALARFTFAPSLRKGAV